MSICRIHSDTLSENFIEIGKANSLEIKWLNDIWAAGSQKGPYNKTENLKVIKILKILSM